MNRPGLTALVTLGLLLAVAACGLPTDSQATSINAEDVPQFLTNTTTTSTTTTLPQPPPSGATTTTITTTTLPRVDLEPVEVYVEVYYRPRGTLDEVKPVKLLMVSPNAQDVVDLLVEPPDEVVDEGLGSSVRDGLVIDIDIDHGMATVELEERILGQMTDSVQSQAFAQLVLTLTRFVPPDQGGISSVKFTSDAEPFPVILPGQGSSNGPVEYDDFRSTIVGVDADPTSTTVDSTTPIDTPAPIDSSTPPTSFPPVSIPPASGGSNS